MKVTLIKSGIGHSYRVKRTLKALGLRKMQHVIQVNAANKSLMGMVNKVRHLVRVDKE